MTAPEQQPRDEKQGEYVCPKCLRLFYQVGKLTAHQVNTHPEVYG